MRKHWLILLFLMVPAVVLGVGSAKRIINLPGFTTDRVLIVNTSGEIDDTAVSETELNLLDGVTGTLVTEAGTATLTNKTIDADGTGNSITNIENADIKAGAAIDRSKIASGTADHVIINDGSGNLSSEATLSKTRGGAGADISNVTIPSTGTLAIEEDIVNKNFWPDFQATNTANVSEDGDYTTYAGTPDNSAAQLSVSNETTDELSGANSYSLDKAAAAANGQAWILELDAPDRLCTTGGNTHYLTFKYETSANYDNSANERVEIFTYGNSSGLQACNARDLLSGTFSNNLPVAPNSGQYQCSYSCASGDTQIDVVLAYTGTASQAVDIVIDEISASPSAVVTAPIVTEWQSYSPTVSNATATASMQYRRIGDSIQIQGTVSFTGSATGTIYVDLPTGLTADMDSTTRSNSVIAYDDSATSFFAGFASAVDNDTKFGFIDDTTVDNWKTAIPFTWANADAIAVPPVTFKINEWSNSNAILSTTQADHQTVKVRAYKTGGNQTVSAIQDDVDLNVVSYDTHGAFNTSTSLFTAPKTGYYFINGAVYGTSITATDSQQINLNVNGTTEAAQFQISNATDKSTSLSTVQYLTKGDTVGLNTQVSTDTSWSIVADERLTYLEIVGLPDFSTFAVSGTTRFPTVQRFTSGSGTYTKPEGVRYIKVKMAGGGGGGSGGGTASAANGSSGGNTTFGTSLLTATGGSGGNFAGYGGDGGSATVNSPAISIVASDGGRGMGYGYMITSNASYSPGGMGGINAFGGAGTGAGNNAGVAAEPNTGAGGGGGGQGNAAGAYSGSGGGAGGYLEAMITNPADTYSYAVGAGGGGGAAGTNGVGNGAAGGSGVIIVEEYY